MTAKQELDGFKLAFVHAIMRSPEEAFAYDIQGKSIAVRAQEFFEREITKRNIATIKTRMELLEALDLIVFMRGHSKRKHNQAALEMACDLIGWLMSEGEDGKTFEAFLEIGRKVVQDHNRAAPGSSEPEPVATNSRSRRR